MASLLAFLLILMGLASFASGVVRAVARTAERPVDWSALGYRVAFGFMAIGLGEALRLLLAINGKLPDL